MEALMNFMPVSNTRLRPIMRILVINLCLLLIALFQQSVYAAGMSQDAFGDPQIVQHAPQRTYHVKNYRLRLHFNEPKDEIFGDELITLEPLTQGFRRFFLNSSDLDIDAVALEVRRGELQPLSFEVQNARLWITLDHSYSPKDGLKVRIVYHGIPRTGLFFVNPNADYPNWPQEIWSQGEPEFNHYWFPCWDYPNDLSTSEVIATVPKGQRVVSNGRLAKVTHRAGLTTYDWVESVPHSSYLTSIAVGPWRKVADHEGPLPVDYYVPRAVSAATARRSFHLTPDMIGFYSRAFGVPYPYEQYAQVVVQNYPFGGMENVSATTLTDSTLHAARAEPEFSSQALVAHELGQHWFGNLVQGRDWADIWLNEGFATYLEALYTQYHDGNDAFRYEMWRDQLAAERQDRDDYLRPIVDDHYRFPLQMFDSITHEKGAVVLDMLRNILDGSQEASQPASQHELLLRALHVYLTRYRARAVNTADLIKTVDVVCGRHLGWFFHEWVYKAGSPHYQVTAHYDPRTRSETLNVLQAQSGRGVPRIFEMPIWLAFHGLHGESKSVRVFNTARSQRFEFPLTFEPAWVDFDPNGVIEKTLDFTQPEPALIAQAEQDPAMMSRLFAVIQLAQVNAAGKPAAVTALTQVLAQDAFYGVRVQAALALGRLHTSTAKAALLGALAAHDSRVRVAVIRALAAFSWDRRVYAAQVRAFRQDPSVAVQAAAAEDIGTSGRHSATAILVAAAKPHRDIHVLKGIFGGLAATRAAQAAGLLLSYARPGVPEHLRIDALHALAGMPVAGRRARRTLLAVERAALEDPFLSTQFAAQNLAAADGLTELRSLIQRQAQTAPTAFQRAAAEAALEKLQKHRWTD